MKKTFLLLILMLAFSWLINGAEKLNVTSKYYDIQADNNNNVHIIYLDGRRKAWHGQIVNNAGTWQIVNITDTGATAVEPKKIRPRISVRPDGQEVHFTWVANTSSDPTELHHCWKNSSGTWNQEIVQTLTGGWYWQYPDVGIDANGVTHITAMKWRYSTSDAPIIYKRKAPGGSWTNQTDIAPATSKNIWNVIFVDYAGRVHVVWNDNKNAIRYKYCNSGGYLSSGTTITLPKYGAKQQRPEVFADRNNNVHVVCNSHDTTGMIFDINYWIKTVSQTSFPAPVQVNINPFTLKRYAILPYPSVGAVSAERAVVSYAWDSDVDDTFEEVYISTNESGSWTVYPVGEGDFTDYTRSVIAVSNDTGYLVWRGTDGYLRLETYDLDPGPTTYNLTVQSSPTTGVNITISPNDNSGNGDGTTNFTRNYDSGTLVTATAPASHSGGDFLRWEIDGTSNTNGTIQVTMNSAHTIQAFYEEPPGYIVAGYSSSFCTGTPGTDSDFVIYKLNKLDGSKIWKTTYGGTNIDSANSIQQTSDGGYIVAGSTESYTYGNSDMAIYKLNSDGNKVWFQHYGGTNADVAYSIQQTSDGGYIVAGSTESYTYGNSDMAIYKLDGSGDKIWFLHYGGTNADAAYSIQQTSDGGYIVAGSTESYAYGNSDFAIYKLNSNGNKVWFKYYGGTNADAAYSIQQTSDGGYIVAGSTESYTYGNSDIAIYKLNSNGNKVWFKHYGGTNADAVYSIQQTSDSGYIVAGSTESYTFGSSDYAIYKLDNSGNKVWFNHFGGTFADTGYSIQQTSDEGYFIVGESYSYCHGTPGVDCNVMVYKLSSSGVKAWGSNYGGVYKDGAHSSD